MQEPGTVVVETVRGEVRRSRRFLVTRATVGPDERPVALKSVIPGQGAAAATAALRHEYAVLEQCLDLPGIPKLVGWRQGRGPPTLVLEDAGPLTLAERSRASVPVDTFVDLALDLAETLGRVHKRGIVHRDIQPSNVVIRICLTEACDAGTGEMVALVDFDQASFGASSVPSPLDEAVEVGAPLAYLSPEQTGRMSRPVDARSDLYSLGALFYELLTGSPPFRSDDPLELVHAHLTRNPVSPTVVASGVPDLASSIVLKLLAKTPEERYQSAAALVLDLRELRERRTRRTHSVEPFELGRLDLSLQLPFPARLFGRERERDALRAAVHRAEAGAAELVLVAGEAGIGKSALVSETREEVVALGGRFVSGKCDLRAVHTPLSSLIEALRGLADDLAAEPDTVRADDRARALGAVAGNGRVLTELVPELETILGGQPPLAKLEPVQTQTRLHVTLQAFLQAFASEGQPLVLFLDDLQWADAATIEALAALATDPDSRSILFLGAFRPQEVPAAHPLRTRLEAAVRIAGVRAERLEIGPLETDALGAFLSAALEAPPDQCMPLADLVARKTGGNPFFVRQLLRSFQVGALLSRVPNSTSAGKWSWDIARIEQAEITENVVDLLVGAIRRLPDDTRELLPIAACLGKRLDLRILCAVTDWPESRVLAVLRPALEEQLVVPDAARGSADGLGYRFAHDRIQQAAYSMLDEPQRTGAHLRIGRRLQAAEHDGGRPEDRTFLIADQFNLGAALLTSNAERLTLARLDHGAGLKAKAAGAFGSALGYMSAGLSALPEPVWDADPNLAMALHRDAAECAYVTADYAASDRWTEEARHHARSEVEQADLYDVRVVSATARGAWREAIEHGREGLRQLGYPLPTPDDAARVVGEEASALDALLAGRHPVVVADLPAMVDPAHKAVLRLLANVAHPAWFQDATFFRFLCLRGQRFVLEHGTIPEAATICCGMAMCYAADDRFTDADGFARAACGLAERFGHASLLAHSTYIRALHVLVWLRPLASVLQELRRTASQARSAGEMRTAGYALLGHTSCSMNAGRDLDEVLRDVEDARLFLRKMHSVGLSNYLLGYSQAIRCLKGLTRGRNLFDEDDFDEAAYAAAITVQPQTARKYHVQRLLTSLVFRDFARAYSHVQAAEAATDALEGRLTLFPLYASLCLTALCDEAPAQREAWLDAVARHRRRLMVWEAACPENFRHGRLLVDGELARLEGRHGDASELFDLAVEAAEVQGAWHLAALGCELAGRHMATRGRGRHSGFYLREAKRLYGRWGATEKVRALEEEFPDLGRLDPGTFAGRAAGAAVGRALDAELDIRSLLKATETLSTEISFDRLLEKLIGVCTQAAGAERVVVVLEEDGAPFVRAAGTGMFPRVDLERTPLVEAPGLAHRAIDQVRTARKPLVIDDATLDPRVAADPYVSARRTKSILALPVQRKADLIATLYFENDQATHAFTPGRLRVLELLSSEIAITLENSLLFERLKGEVAERTRAEATVRFLANAGTELSASLDEPILHEKVARLAVPALADWCVVDVVDDDGRIRRVAGAHVDPAKVGLLRQLQDSPAPDWTSPQPSPSVLRSRAPLLIEDLTDERLESLLHDVEHARVVRSLGARSLLVVPMVAHGRTLGALACVSSASGRRYTSADQTAALELGYRAALAIDNARLFQSAKNAVQVREDFLSVASHELHTPLTSLMLSVQSIERERIPVTPETMKATISRIGRQGRRLTRLVDDLLDVAQIASNRLSVNLAPVDLAALAHEVVERFDDEFARAGTPVTVRADDRTIGTWDRSRLDQVISNLLSNAIKFGAGSPVEVTVGRRGDRAELVVRDEGIGIAPDRLPHVFERFERGVSASQYGGLGLGLYIVRSIVEGLGGEVTCESRVGKGATFVVSLPLQESEPSQAP